jgi:hypothetical protein
MLRRIRLPMLLLIAMLFLVPQAIAKPKVRVYVGPPVYTQAYPSYSYSYAYPYNYSYSYPAYRNTYVYPYRSMSEREYRKWLKRQRDYERREWREHDRRWRDRY